MRDTVNRATLRVLVSFMACVVIVGVVVWAVRGGGGVGPWSIAGATGQAAFGSGPSDDAVTLFITEANLCDAYFREPFETCLILTYSLGLVSFSTHEATRIGVSADILVDRLRQMGISPKDMAVIVHNHFTPAAFTDADKATYRFLKARGFTGAFGIWYTASSKFVAIEDSQ